MNVELLNLVKAKILSTPEEFIMFDYRCGSAHCICGWAAVLSGETVPQTSLGFYLKGLQVLNLEPDQGIKLFIVAHWPRKFEEAWNKAFDFFDTNKKAANRAKIAAERIDHFISTGE